MAISRVVSPRTGKVSWRVRVIRHGQVVESQTFGTERDAKLFDAARRTQVTRPDWVDPARGRVLVGQVADEKAGRSPGVGCSAHRGHRPWPVASTGGPELRPPPGRSRHRGRGGRLAR